ncbi:hypothetical protein GSI_11652 [Ganoderma sinense ZZ0214-1]|uniref:Uncharacterized protein n=1 Tax=Ganoderma sinense ZZ0214-1 TaxID=1077348 RepID=A0A2G8RWK6_9APHY|nr:hypothetical protein GSI_11652 [Ganoderma sinense ZZ0214-1]
MGVSSIGDVAGEGMGAPTVSVGTADCCARAMILASVDWLACGGGTGAGSEAAGAPKPFETSACSSPWIPSTMFCAWWMTAGSTSPSSGPMCSARVGATEDAAIPFQSFARRLISSSPSILSTSTSSISAYAHAASTAESASLDRPFPLRSRRRGRARPCGA